MIDSLVVVLRDRELVVAALVRDLDDRVLLPVEDLAQVARRSAVVSESTSSRRRLPVVAAVELRVVVVVAAARGERRGSDVDVSNATSGGHEVLPHQTPKYRKP